MKTILHVLQFSYIIRNIMHTCKYVHMCMHIIHTSCIVIDHAQVKARQDTYLPIVVQCDKSAFWLPFWRYWRNPTVLENLNLQ